VAVTDASKLALFGELTALQDRYAALLAELERRGSHARLATAS
jgi:hypothetical protein